MPYKRKLPKYSTGRATVRVDIVRLDFDQGTGQHSDTAMYSQIEAVFQVDFIQMLPAGSGPIVSQNVYYFSFEPGVIIETGYYILYDNRRWIVKDIMNANLAGGRVLVRVEASGN